MLKLDVAFLDLLGATSSRSNRSVLPRLPSTRSSLVIPMSLNTASSNNELMEAFRDRTVKIDIYNTTLQDEVSIYRKDFPKAIQQMWLPTPSRCAPCGLCSHVLRSRKCDHSCPEDETLRRQDHVRIH